MIEQLNEFFNRPGINKTGICDEAGISIQHLNRVLYSGAKLTPKFKKKLMVVFDDYKKRLNELADS